MLLRDNTYKTGQLDQGSTSCQKLFTQFNFFSNGLHSNHRVHQMLTNVSINILVQIDERTYAFKRKESFPRKSMYVIINHFETNQPCLTFSASLPVLGCELQPLDWH